MATLTGSHAERVQRVRELHAVKGRREQGRFAFEGPTLLEEALRAGISIDELYVTDAVLAANADVRRLDREGVAVSIVDERTARRISDLETPTGLVAVTPTRLHPVPELLGYRRILVLADLNDPGNAGTLLRCAEAFGADGVVFGSLGVDPYHPKVVRGAMGAIFRIPLAVADPTAFAAALGGTATVAIGLDAHGEDIRSLNFPEACAIVVGHERRGLGIWEGVCARTMAIPMSGSTESLNAAIAGSIALYEAAKRQ